MRVLGGKDFIRLRSEFERWLGNYSWRRFITLASNDPTMTSDRAVHVLKQWDARINRKLVGPDWHKRIEDRTWAFFFLEKAGANPHWHGLVRFMDWYPGQADKQAERFDKYAHNAWSRLVAGGSVDVQPVTDRAGAISYVAKAVPSGVSYEYYVVPDEFR